MLAVHRIAEGNSGAESEAGTASRKFSSDKTGAGTAVTGQVKQ